MRTFSRPATGLQRDVDGHRTGFKLLVRERIPMSNEAYLRWGHKQRRHISKSKYVWRVCSSTKNKGMPNGIPIEYMRNNKVMVEFLINNWFLYEGIFAIQGWTNGKTRTHTKFTPHLAVIQVYSMDRMKYRVMKAGRLDRYWFRKDVNKVASNKEFKY